MSHTEVMLGAKGLRCTMHLPHDGTAQLNSMRQCSTAMLAVAPFAHPGFDAGACVVIAIGPPGQESLIPLDLAEARIWAGLLGDAIQQAEKLQ